MAVANTLAYYNTVIISAIKSFIIQAPGNIYQGILKGEVSLYS